MAWLAPEGQEVKSSPPPWMDPRPLGCDPWEFGVNPGCLLPQGPGEMAHCCQDSHQSAPPSVTLLAPNHPHPPAPRAWPPAPTASEVDSAFLTFAERKVQPFQKVRKTLGSEEGGVMERKEVKSKF